jgi:VanZ family protein
VGACVGLIAVVSWALLSPMPFAAVRDTPLSALSTVSDLLLHCGAYGLLSFVCSLAVADRQNDGARRVLLALLIAHGVVSELLQTLIPYRSCDPFDGLANMIGIAMGTVAVTWAIPFFRYAKIAMIPNHATDPTSVER